MYGHKPVMSKSVHLRPGISSRRRSRASESANGDSGPTKRQRTNVSFQLSSSDHHQHTASHQPLLCSMEFGDQRVPSQNGDVLLFSADPDDGLQLSLFDSPSSSTVKMEAGRKHPLGYFAVLPTEIFHLVLALLENSDLGVLANASGEMCIAVCGYVYTPAGLDLVLPQYSKGDFAEPWEFTQLGTCTCMYTIQ